MKMMNKILLILLLISGGLNAQELVYKDSTEYIQLTVPDAQIVDFWGRKGIASVDLIDRLEQKVFLLERSEDLQSKVNDNMRLMTEEYRSQVNNAARLNADLQRQLYETKELRDAWKIKAQRRGYQNGALAAIIGIMTYITLKP